MLNPTTYDMKIIDDAGKGKQGGAEGQVKAKGTKPKDAKKNKKGGKDDDYGEEDDEANNNPNAPITFRPKGKQQAAAKTTKNKLSQAIDQVSMEMGGGMPILSRGPEVEIASVKDVEDLKHTLAKA